MNAMVVLWYCTSSVQINEAGKISTIRQKSTKNIKATSENVRDKLQFVLCVMYLQSWMKTAQSVYKLLKNRHCLTSNRVAARDIRAVLPSTGLAADLCSIKRKDGHLQIYIVLENYDEFYIFSPLNSEPYHQH